MALRRFTASNRHWVFVKQQILGPLNDQLAIRQGAEFTFEVPEPSFDWDVEFSVIKDRSGNTLREQYTAAWAQPSLVTPGEKVYQLGVRINWRNPDVYGKNTAQFDQNEVAQLMAKVDGILGSPIKNTKSEKKEISQEKPSTVTNQKRERPLLMKSSIGRIINAAENLAKESVSNQEAADTAFNAIKVINDAKKLNSIDMQQIEVQSAYNKVEKMKSNPETSLLGFIATKLCDKLRSSDIQDADIYDMLSRISREVLDSIKLIQRSPDFKIEGVNEIETKTMEVLKDTSFNGELERIYASIDSDQLGLYLDNALKQIETLRDKSLSLDISDIPAPQVIDKYIDEIKEKPAQQ